MENESRSFEAKLSDVSLVYYNQTVFVFTNIVRHIQDSSRAAQGVRHCEAFAFIVAPHTLELARHLRHMNVGHRIHSQFLKSKN